MERQVEEQLSRASDNKRPLKDRKSASLEELEKMAKVAEIMDLLEETRKDKNWLIHQIKRSHIKAEINPSMSAVAILKSCPKDFVINILNMMKFSEIIEFEAPPPLTCTYHWFFTDIVSSTDPTITTNEQAYKIIVLNKLIEKTDIFRQRDPDSTLILPTGDGMAIGFTDSPEKPLLLALELHRNLQLFNTQKSKEKEKLIVRVGLDTGPVYLIKDLNGKENVWGPGIIMARRVMDLAGEMNIIASARIASDIRTLRPEYKNILHPIGDYFMKHGVKSLIYNVYGDGFGNRKAPREDKIEKSSATEEDIKTVNRFIYNQVEVSLDVTDVSNMLVRHSILWNFVNVSNEPIGRIFYYLGGDVPRNFPDLNVVVKDEEQQELEMISLNVNKPMHKEFYMKLRKPLRPKQKGRSVQLFYDWEEPDRQYTYRFASRCKKFKYSLSAPKDFQINHKVVHMDLESGEKRYADVPAKIEYLKNRTIVSWEAANLPAYDTYRFDW